ncbi:MAG: hypothetical protein ACLQAH_08125 [Limisphaerales bacterium]
MKNQFAANFTFFKYIVALTFLLSSLCIAQENNPDQQSVIRETQQMSHQENKLTIVWWVPEQFWRISFAANHKLTEEQINGFIKTVKPYTLVAVVKGEFGSFGGVTYESETAIRSKLFLIDSEGNQYSPLDSEEISADMQNFLGMMKPLFANMLGAMGKNFGFYIFPAKGKNGKSIADPEKEGHFSIQLGEEKFKWRLPLGSLLPPKTCPKCGEKLSGSYKYCPFDGTSLKK